MLNIYKEKAGVISPDPIWVCIQPGYVYTHYALVGLLWTILTEWQHDKHIVG